MTTSLDPRLNACRPDLADARLKGKVAADRFVEGELRRVTAPATPLRRTPSPDAPLDSELIRGEPVRVFAVGDEGRSWVQNETDGYVGYVATEALGPTDPAPTHRVTALRTFVYPGPDMKLPAVSALSIGSRVALGEAVETRGTRFLKLVGGEGAVAAIHVAPLDAPPAPDFVAVAERFREVPYLWGGRTSLGLDCSALVQLALMAAGHAAPRDTDLQANAVGHPVAAAADLGRGDLVFWKGHVGILTGRATLLHASGHHMAVVTEPLAEAIARMGEPAVIRRLQRPSPIRS